MARKSRAMPIAHAGNPVSVPDREDWYSRSRHTDMSMARLYYAVAKAALGGFLLKSFGRFSRCVFLRKLDCTVSGRLAIRRARILLILMRAGVETTLRTADRCCLGFQGKPGICGFARSARRRTLASHGFRRRADSLTGTGKVLGDCPVHRKRT